MRDSPWSGEAKYRALLAVAQAANSHRDLSSVLDAVAGALEGLVPLDLISVVTHERGGIRNRAIHWRKDPRRPDERQDLYVRRLSDAHGASDEIFAHIPVVRDAMERDRRTIVLNDVRNDSRLAGEAAGLKAAGVECVVVLPMTMDDRFVAAMGVGRTSVSPFLSDEVSILEDISRPVTTAVVNALAFEEILKLRSRLEDENLALREEITATAAEGGIIGASSGLRDVLERVSRVAATDSTVLITGETGTGKELVARAIHAGSARAKRALVKVNCAALPDNLLESEWFGYEKGAFTGAFARKTGRFELADNGTLFLDEIGDVPLHLQAKLLRVLQEREIERLGATRPVRVDFRLVAATNADLQSMVNERKFRSDLFYRLNVFPVRIPPLRERPDDIPALVGCFTQRYAKRLRRRIDSVPRETMDALCRWPWPGNVRELQNVIERAVILSPGGKLQVPAAEFSLPATRPGTLETAEREHIMKALLDTNWVVGGPGGAAARLGLNRTTLISTMKRLGIERPADR